MEESGLDCVQQVKNDKVTIRMARGLGKRRGVVNGC